DLNLDEPGVGVLLDAAGHPKASGGCGHEIEVKILLSVVQSERTTREPMGDGRWGSAVGVVAHGSKNHQLSRDGVGAVPADLHRTELRAVGFQAAAEKGLLVGFGRREPDDNVAV